MPFRWRTPAELIKAEKGRRAAHNARIDSEILDGRSLVGGQFGYTDEVGNFIPSGDERLGSLGALSPQLAQKLGLPAPLPSAPKVAYLPVEFDPRAWWNSTPAWSRYGSWDQVVANGGAQIWYDDSSGLDELVSIATFFAAGALTAGAIGGALGGAAAAGGAAAGTGIVSGAELAALVEAGTIGIEGAFLEAAALNGAAVAYSTTSGAILSATLPSGASVAFDAAVDPFTQFPSNPLHSGSAVDELLDQAKTKVVDSAKAKVAQLAAGGLAALTSDDVPGGSTAPQASGGFGMLGTLLALGAAFALSR